MLELAPHLESALATGRTLIVPTAQRTAAVRIGFATRQLATGRRAFRTPDVQSLSGWLRSQPQRDAAGRVLRPLSASEEWLLWREAVAQATARLSLGTIPGLVDAVRRSVALLFDWRIDREALRRIATPEVALLTESLTTMEAQLSQLSAAAPWRAMEALSECPAPRQLPLFAGFAFHTPARRALLSAWGCADGLASLDPPAATRTQAAAASDPTTELAQVAAWCAERLRTLPSARLLVIVPELARRQHEVRRTFDAALAPAQGAYALEGAPGLLDYGPIREALRTLQVLTQPLELAEVSQWLRGSFWPGPQAAHRAQLDIWLRGVVPPRLAVRQLLQALKAAPPTLLAPADEVAGRIAQALEALEGAGQSSFGEWCGRFAAVLASVGLTAAAPRQRGSHTQQVLQRLDELLQECVQLPAAQGRHTVNEALALFTQLLTRTRFEPASGDAAVTLTASFADPILHYDGIWVSGLHAGAIPEHARFDPFIPAALQRQAGIISADAAALVEQAQRSLAVLSRSCQEFIVSAPAHDKDLELASSPLLALFAAQPFVAPADAAPPPAQAIRAGQTREVYTDGPGLPWAQNVPLPSGTRAIELQSRCPFRAYAQLRLGADPVESPQPGITPRERGRLLHRALELLWQRLGGSQALLAARTTGALVGSISECVAQAGAEILHGADPDGAPDEAFSPAADATGLAQLRRAAIARELTRATRLIRTLCELEAQRAPFFIQELESAHRVQIGGALINVRVDRVDRLDDGTHAIVDYKSGRAVTPDWEIERTTHPQLLVYLLAAGVPVSALAVAHLDPKSVVFKGIGDADGRLPGVKADGEWSALLARWREQVAVLAADFMRGHASVTPADRACDHCHLHAFCRIADVEQGA